MSCTFVLKCVTLYIFRTFRKYDKHFSYICVIFFHMIKIPVIIFYFLHSHLYVFCIRPRHFSIHFKHFLNARLTLYKPFSEKCLKHVFETRKYFIECNVHFLMYGIIFGIT